MKNKTVQVIKQKRNDERQKQRLEKYLDQIKKITKEDKGETK